MIVIDGMKSGLQVNNFQNLEELLVKVMEDGNLEDRIVTDVLVDEEHFSEIYPHQAEDISTDEFQSVEIVTVSVSEMAVNITEELYKVVRMMEGGGRGIAQLFRQADDGEALEMLQDLLDVTRDFLTMIGVLRSEFNMGNNDKFNESAEEITNLFTEMSEVMENEDWILLADILEYEFNPAVNRWKMVIDQIREDIREQSER